MDGLSVRQVKRITRISLISTMFKLEKMHVRRNQVINDSRIKYLLVADSKIYKVKDIDFCNLTIEAEETDITITNIPENEVFPIEGFREFKVRLYNGGGMGEIIDFVEWMKTNKKCN